MCRHLWPNTGGGEGDGIADRPSLARIFFSPFSFPFFFYFLSLFFLPYARRYFIRAYLLSFVSSLWSLRFSFFFFSFFLFSSYCFSYIRSRKGKRNEPSRLRFKMSNEMKLFEICCVICSEYSLNWKFLVIFLI